MPRVSRRLVIDASVARSAGGEEATFPQSRYCRDFLKSVRERSHRLVMTQEIADEWDRHQSNFAKRWRVSMKQKRKVEELDNTQNSDLSGKVERVAANEGTRKAMLKDLHLIEAALASDRTVISLDEKARKPFAEASGSVGELKKVVWVNPAQEKEEAISWLQNGAKAEKKRQLGYVTTDR